MNVILCLIFKKKKLKVRNIIDIKNIKSKYKNQYQEKNANKNSLKKIF